MKGGTPVRLGYCCYGTDSARLALYHSDQPIDVIIEYTDPATKQQRVMYCEVKAPMITVAPVFSQCSFTLKAWQRNAEVGVCRGDFMEGTLILTERTGCFAGLSPYKLKDAETIEVKKSDGCPGIASTDMVLLSRKWEGYQLIVGQKGIEDWKVQEWHNSGLIEKTWKGRRRITGWTLRYGGSAAMCSAALVLLSSGTHAGKAGWLLWGDDGGLNISGALGDIAGALWMPSIESFPIKVKEKVGLPPESVAPKSRRTGNALGGIGIL
jgi:hypothetical protein